MPTDMRAYADRYAKAIGIPFQEGEGLPWWVESPEELLCHAHMSEAQQWAFWGPLADELNVRPRGADKDGIPGTLSYEESRSWLEAIAEAVATMEILFK